MDQFREGHHVWLSSSVYGTYLHADEDGHGVSLHDRRDSMNAAWLVDVYQPPDAHMPYLLLHSAAYGRYLAATDEPAPRGLHVEQRGCDHPEVEPIPWRALRTESADEVYLQDFYRGYLRADWNTGVSVVNVDDRDNPSATMRWVVEPIPATRRMPGLPLPLQTGLHPAFYFNPDELLWREITYVWPNVEGVIVNHDVFFFRGRSVFWLRQELARRLQVDVSQLVMSLATRRGRFFPLVVDLPRNQQALIVVVDFAGTPAHAELRYADVHAAW